MFLNRFLFYFIFTLHLPVLPLSAVGLVTSKRLFYGARLLFGLIRSAVSRCTGAFFQPPVLFISKDMSCFHRHRFPN